MALIAEQEDLIDAAARNRRPIVLWLVAVLLMILAVVGVGGVTRLTESGLSIVDWRPLMGVVPPLSEVDWQARFDQYKSYPEYQVLRPGMTLEEFKKIFFWEYLHRMLARGVAIVFLLPYLAFLFLKKLDRKLAWKLAGGFLLGGLQGLLGWYMVKSGLSDKPHVSHYRLAAHLGLAFFLFGYLLWILLDLVPQRDQPRFGWHYRNAVLGFLGLLVLQIIYGAFVAGMNAGYMYNTWPTMMGKWIPPGWLALSPTWTNWVKNPVTVQFAHRTLAFLVLFAAFALWAWSFVPGFTRRQRVAAAHLAVGTLAQFLVGIVTLVMVVPVGMATTHQVLACLLLGATVCLLHSSGPVRAGVGNG